MRVLYDYQIFELQKFGGVSRYFYELIQYFESTAACEWQLPIQYSENEYLSSLPALKNALKPKPDSYNNFLSGLDFKGKWTLYSLRNKFFPGFDRGNYNKRLSINAMQKNKFDLFHPTFFDRYFLDHVGNKPFVLTIYDMIHEKFPQYYQKSLVTKQKRELAARANMIIAISENTKQDIIDIYQIDEHKIKVIYLGNSLREINLQNDQKFSVVLPRRYLLYVGGRGIYKNFYPFLKAILPMLQADKDLHVVCTGEPFTKEEVVLFKNYNLIDRIIHFAAHDELLSILYSKALAFVFPSLYEGFGLPVLEAFSFGCPAILSNTSSLPEVGGKAALYFNPSEPLSMYEAVLEIIQNTGLRQQLIEKGYEQLKKFSWELTGKQTLKCYEELL